MQPSLRSRGGVTFSQTDPKSTVKSFTRSFMTQTLSKLSTCDVSPALEKLLLLIPSACVSSAVSLPSICSEQKIHRKSQCCFSKSYAGVANPTTDWNLSASVQQWETDPLFVQLNVYSNLELFVEHNGIEAQSEITCRQKYSITLKKHVSASMNIHRVIFHKETSRGGKVLPLGFKFEVKFETSSLFMQRNKNYNGSVATVHIFLFFKRGRSCFSMSVRSFKPLDGHFPWRQLLVDDCLHSENK